MITTLQILETYLESFQDRLKKLVVARCSAIMSLVALLISVIGAYLAVRTGFSSAVVNSSRLLLVLFLTSTLLTFFILPLKKLRSQLGERIEARVPDFCGRIETYLGMADKTNPFRVLLAEDCMKIAEVTPVNQQVQDKELFIPAGAAALFIGVLLWAAVAGPGFLNYGIQHLWAGWLFSDLMPPQSIVVTPGDEAVRRGGTVRLLARMVGFDPFRASIHAKIGDINWQEVEMVSTEQGFEFTFFSVREPVNYYVTAAGIRSPGYNISIVDLPDIQNLKLTFNYPEWTQRSPETFDPGSDIHAIKGTGIDLEITTDAPLPNGVLVLNNELQPLKLSENTGKISFQIIDDGQYYLAAKIGNELVRLSDDYFIKILEDSKPNIKLVRPGRDWSASRIEEVTVQAKAEDDYVLENMELHYSVNGGEWYTVTMPVDGRTAVNDHVFMLESLRSFPELDFDEQLGTELVAGDLIAYYVQASDRDQITNSDIYFIQVQPFDRRYTQSQQMGGAGGGSGNDQQEISQRQKEIIVSTWNLIREKTASKGEIDGQTRDIAILLSALQIKLAEQAQTLANRTNARQLSADEQIAKFVEYIEKAAEAMHPASDRLAAINLEEAIKPEQVALQYLLRAEAVFTDIQVSFQQGGGGGFSAGQDLAEMFELEMDLEKNQYETGNPASPNSSSRETDDTMQQLEELARRQQQLADNLSHSQNMTEAQRWQQEMLRRDAEQLRDRMEQKQQQASTSQSTEQTSSGNQSGENGDASSTDASRRLESAIRAMSDAVEEMRNSPGSESLQRSAQEAQRQLENVRSQVAQDQRRNMQQAFENMASQAEDLYVDQVRIERELQDAVRRALAQRQKENSTRVSSGLTSEQEVELSSEKKKMSELLQRLQQNIYSSTGNYSDVVPGAVRDLEAAANTISQTELKQRLDIAAEYIEYGATPYIAGSESAVTQALDEVRSRLRRAQSLVQGSQLEDANNLDKTLAQTRSLRRELERLANSNTEGSDGQSETQLQASQDGQSGNQRVGQVGAGLWNGNQIWRGGVIDPLDWDRVGRNLDDTARAIRNLVPELRALELSADEINTIRDLTLQLEQQFDFSGSSRNESILLSEYSAALSLLEQLEIRLDKGLKNKLPDNVRSTATEPIPAEYKDIVAEYYRRLSRE